MYSEKWLQVLQLLLPKGIVWNFIVASQREDIYKALSAELSRADDFLQAVKLESLPDTTSQLLDEWVSIYGIDENLTDQEKKDTATAYYTSIGNQALNYIQDQMDLLNLGITLVESRLYIPESPSAGLSPVVIIVVDYQSLSQAQIDNISKLMEYYKPGHVIALFQSLNPFVFATDPDGAGFGGTEPQTLQIDIGAGAVDLQIDIGAGAVDLLIDSPNSFFYGTGGGEFQSINIFTDNPEEE